MGIAFRTDVSILLVNPFFLHDSQVKKIHQKLLLKYDGNSQLLLCINNKTINKSKIKLYMHFCFEIVGK